MSRQPEPEVRYEKATRGNVATLTMFAGPPGSGKTKSALRLATGLAGPDGWIAACDTEHGRMLYYADEFDFRHHQLKEPFNPARFEHAALSAQRQGAAVWICDSLSHEHVGPGGVLDMHEAELQRMAGDDWSRREAFKMTAWIKPKAEHKHFMQRMWQLNFHIILCCHADKKIEMVSEFDPKTKRTKSKPVDKGYWPVCSPDIPYAMTASFLFDAATPGVPIWLKRFDKLEALVDTNNPIDEDTGRRIAAWARGDKTPAATRKTQVQVSHPPAEQPAGPTPGPTEPENRQTPPENRQTEEPPPPPPQEDVFPGDAPNEQLPLGDKPKATKGRTEAVVAELLAKFEAVTVRADHLAIVDVKDNRDRIAWIKKNKPDLFGPLDAAMKASWARTMPTPRGQAA